MIGHRAIDAVVAEFTHPPKVEVQESAEVNYLVRDGNEVIGVSRCTRSTGVSIRVGRNGVDVSVSMLPGLIDALQKALEWRGGK